MQFLLTSGGLSNQALKSSLLKLAGKSATELKVAYIPTAANIEAGDKTWVIESLTELQNLGFPYIDIVDIAALTQPIWKSRLDAVNIIVMGGGDTAYLLKQIHQSGLAEYLPELLRTRVYMGISAGSMVVGPDMKAEALKLVYPEETSGDENGLRYVDFYILPHLGSPYFPHVTEENAQRVAEISGKIIYLIDDAVGIEIDGENLTVIGEGTCLKY